MRYFTITLGLFLAGALLFIVFLSIVPGLEIRTNELVIVDDHNEVFRLKKTPRSDRIANERWGEPGDFI